MTTHLRLSDPRGLCCVSLAVLASLAFAAQRARVEVRFQPGRAAPDAGWVGCAEGGYWSAHAPRSRREWGAHAPETDAASPLAETRVVRAPSAACDAGSYVDLGR